MGSEKVEVDRNIADENFEALEEFAQEKIIFYENAEIFLTEEIKNGYNLKNRIVKSKADTTISPSISKSYSRLKFNSVDKVRFFFSSCFLNVQFARTLSQVNRFRESHAPNGGRLNKILDLIANRNSQNKDTLGELRPYLQAFQKGFSDFYFNPITNKFKSGLISPNDPLSSNPNFIQYYGLGNLMLEQILDLDSLFVDIFNLTHDSVKAAKLRAEVNYNLFSLYKAKKEPKAKLFSWGQDVFNYLQDFISEIILPLNISCYHYWKKILGSRGISNPFDNRLLHFPESLSQFLEYFDTLVEKFPSYPRNLKRIATKQFKIDNYIQILEKAIDPNGNRDIFFSEGQLSRNIDLSKHISILFGYNSEADKDVHYGTVAAMEGVNQTIYKLFHPLSSIIGISGREYASAWSIVGLSNLHSIKIWQHSDGVFRYLLNLFSNTHLKIYSDVKNLNIPDFIHWLSVPFVWELPYFKSTRTFHKKSKSNINFKILYSDGHKISSSTGNMEELNNLSPISQSFDKILEIKIDPNSKVASFVAENSFRSLPQMPFKISPINPLYNIRRNYHNNSVYKAFIPDSGIVLQIKKNKVKTLDTVIFEERLDYSGTQWIFRHRSKIILDMKDYALQKQNDIATALLCGYPYIASIGSLDQIAWYLDYPFGNDPKFEQWKNKVGNWVKTPHIIGLYIPLLLDKELRQLKYILGRSDIKFNNKSLLNYSFETIMCNLHIIVEDSENWKLISNLGKIYFGYDKNVAINDITRIQEAFGIGFLNKFTNKKEIKESLVIFREVASDQISGYDHSGKISGSRIKKLITLHMNYFWYNIRNLKNEEIANQLMNILQNWEIPNSETLKQVQANSDFYIYNNLAHNIVFGFENIEKHYNGIFYLPFLKLKEKLVF